ncbi:hypothetical protein CO174_00255 [Candidatus Uhrbacteria bacterium CG_4_9_14_3_um_filter_50_9]|uniref:Uncharacterized protein n=1 Tax=Candidatus Uhrbacteria bacterium CG_4_9_14_3_um_filter_50_9 TaxID=1975035 RepID=A0A2M7XEZ9_9BACT|nr:MAG: hypothetical protein CO174_00255 [Candidatus Uhrbacteria bacterium CG_4_9_14_3_um_filter_50_9]
MSAEDKIIEKLIELGEDIKDVKVELASKPSREEVMSSLDAQGVILQRLDQERLFTLERIKRIEADVDQMKVMLDIA